MFSNVKKNKMQIKKIKLQRKCWIYICNPCNLLYNSMNVSNLEVTGLDFLPCNLL